MANQINITSRSLARSFSFLLIIVCLLSSIGLMGISPASAQRDAGTPTPSGTRAFPQGAAVQHVDVPSSHIPSVVVIRFAANSSKSQRNDYVKSFGGVVIKRIEQINAYVVRVPKGTSTDSLPPSPIVVGSEPDEYVGALDFIPNDPRYPEQWALPAIGAPSAWEQLPADAPKVTVAVIDSGICADHPDLVGRIIAGWDFLESDSVPRDDFGHGCSVSGVIAANMNNNTGMAGVAPNAQIMPLRVLNASGVGSYSDVAAAIVYAADNGAQVINLSLGGSSPSTTLENAVNYAIGKGVIVVAAAGNNGTEGALYPAAYPAVIAVGSVDSSLQHSSFSNYGSQIDIWAPGRDILTTRRDSSYSLVSGTSFAAPYVAGAEAVSIVTRHTIRLEGSFLALTLRSSGTQTPNVSPTGIQAATPTVTISPTVTTPPQDICMIDGTIQVPMQSIVAIRTALAAAAKDVDFNGADCFAPIDIRTVDEWSLVTMVGLVNANNGTSWSLASNGVWSDNTIVQVTADGTQAAVAGTRAFSELLALVPEKIFSKEAKQALDPLGHAPAISDTETYIFPFQSGYQVKYGSRGVHLNEFSAVMGSGSMAVDLLSDGNTSVNHAPNYLIAVASGIVVWRCQDTSKLTTYVKLQKSDGSSKFLYAHILASTAPANGAEISQGQYIGQLRTGSFDDGNCGYASQNSDQFHVHLEFPAVSTLTLSDWTLNTSNGVWTRGAETWYPDQWRQIGSGSTTCYSLYVNVSGGGTAYSSPSTSTCGFLSFPAGTTVQLIATPYTGWHFDHWSGGPSGGATTNYTVNGNTTATAIFVQNNVIPTPTTQPPPPADNWVQDFYSDNNLGSHCGSTRYESDVYVFRDSRSGWSPPSGCPSASSAWSVHMVRSVYFQGGTYQFGLFYDDGARLYIPDISSSPLVDGWTGSAHYEGYSISAGYHQVILDYKNNAGDAIVQLWWQGPGALPGYNQTKDPNQWWVNYWGNQFLWQDSVGRQNEGSGFINHDWGSGGPGFGIPSDHFSIKYERTVGFECGTYRFHLRSDDGSRLFIDGSAVPGLDHWVTNVWDNTVDVQITAGDHVLMVDYFEDGGNANLYFDWTKVGTCVPTTPSNLNWTSTSPTSITITWNDVTNEDGYNIYQWNGSLGFVYLASVGANQISFTETKSTCGWDQFYEVSAYNSYGESPLTLWTHGYTQSCPDTDLVVTDIIPEPSSPKANDDIRVRVNVQNFGSVPADGFWIDLYVDDQPVGCSDWGSYYVGASGLAGNSRQGWNIIISAGTLSPGTHQLTAFADSGCEVMESNENNNIYSYAPVSITVTTAPTPPVHDDFNSSKLINSLTYTDIIDVSGATRAPDDPYVPICDLDPGMASVWYRYTPTANGLLSLDTFGSSYDTYIGVWSGTRGNLSLIDCNDDYNNPDNVQSALDVNLQAGTTYYIEVAQWTWSVYSYSMSTSALSSRSGALTYPSASDNTKLLADVGAQAGGQLQLHSTYHPAPGGFNKSSPSNGASNQSLSPTLSWNVSSNANSYEYCFDTTNDNSCDNWISTGTATSTGLSELPQYTTYYWHVRAINSIGTTYANGSSSAFWSFTTGGVPGAFGKSSPANGTSNQPLNPTLTWGSSSNATAYEYCYDTSNDNACSSWINNGTSTSKSLSGLAQNTTYYWHVRAINSLGTTYSNASATAYWSFTTGVMPSAFSKVSPTNGATGQPLSLTLVWDPSYDASSYEYCYDTTNDNACTTWIDNGTATSVSLSDLSFDTTYYWQVRAINSIGTTYANGSTTVFWSFRTVTPTATAGTYDDKVNVWGYSGTWLSQSASSAYGGSYRYTTTAGASATVYFSGVQVMLYFTKNSSMGNLAVYIDDTLVTTINQKSSLAGYKKTWLSPVYADGIHKVTFVRSSSKVNVDALQVIPAPDFIPPAAITNLVAATGSSYGQVSLGWTSVGDDGNTGTAASYQVRYATTIIDTDAKWTAATPVTNGLPVPAIAGTPQTITVSGLVGGVPYYFAIRAVDDGSNPGALSNSPSAVPTSPPPVLAGTYDDKSSAWYYSGTWLTQSASSAYGGSYKYTTATNASATVYFSGTQVMLYYTRNSSMGNLDVFIDGVQVTTINQKSSLAGYKKTWLSPVYADGMHTVTFMRSSAKVNVDAIQVIPAPDFVPPAAILDLAAVTGGSYGQVDLDWTAVGDDGNTGTAASYQVRYSTAIIDSDAKWSAAIPVTSGMPAPAVAGTPQGMTVSGLVPSLTYYFAIRAVDDGGNPGALSNSPLAVALTPVPVPSGVYENTDSNWIFNGTWTTATTTGASGGNVATSSTVGSNALLVFSGSGFTLHYYVRSGNGSLAVYVDGVLKTVINQKSSTTRIVWKTYALSGLTPGTHVIQVVDSTGKVNFDYITIAP